MDRPGREDPAPGGDGREPREADVAGEPGQGHLLPWGLAPLPLVETALSPLDFQPGAALDHHARFVYQDQHQQCRDGDIALQAPGGLSPTDELVLYGLLAITFADPSPTPELAATPDFLCHRLGLPIGGEHFARLRQALRRLQGVTYRNSAWEDPGVHRHREIAFRLLSLDLPFCRELPSANDPALSHEDWTILWDPFFFKAVGDHGGAFLFDFEAYRALKPQARRGFLLLLQRFHLGEQAPTFDLRRLAVDQLGFAAGLEIKNIRQKLKPILRSWANLGLIPADVDVETLFDKQGPGQWSIRLPRGPRVGQLVATGRPPLRIAEHFAYGQLKRLGLSEKKIEEVFRDHGDRLTAVIRMERLAREAVERDPVRGTSKDEKFLYYLPRKQAIPRWYENKLRERRRRATRPSGVEKEERIRYRVDRAIAFEVWIEEPAVVKRLSDLIEALWESEQKLHPSATEVQAKAQAEDQSRLRLGIESRFPEFSEWLAGRPALDL